jgi:hypothetical protein
MLIMSKYDAELRRRLAGGEDLTKVVDWYSSDASRTSWNGRTAPSSR